MGVLDQRLLGRSLGGARLLGGGATCGQIEIVAPGEEPGDGDGGDGGDGEPGIDRTLLLAGTGVVGLGVVGVALAARDGNQGQ